MRVPSPTGRISVPRPLWAVLGLVLIFCTVLAGIYTDARTATAATNSTINFQARLMSNTGAIAPDGNYNVEFKLYNASTSSGSSQGSCTGDGACQWVETRTGGNQVRVANGYLTVNLGSVSAFGSGINWDQDLWLTMNIGGTGSPSWDGEMSPRLKLTAVPYALRAGALAGGSGANTTVLDTGTPSGNNLLHLPAETGTLCVQSSLNCGFVAGTASNFIQNGTTVQTGANFNIRSNATGSVGAVIQGANGQTADLLNLQTWNGTSASTVFGVNNVGALTLAGTGTTNFTTPGGSSVPTKINIPTYNPGNFGQILALGLPSSADNTARAISLLDARTSAHQPTIAVFSPNENEVLGLSWDGSNVTSYLKTSAPTLNIVTNAGNIATFNDTDISLLQNTVVAANKNVTINNGTGTFTQSYTNTSSVAATFNVTDSAASGTTAVQGVAINLTGTNNGTGSNAITGLQFGNVSAATNNSFYGMNFGTGFTDILRYNGTQLISGTGIVQSVAVSGSYTGITGVGTLTSGALGSGFTTVGVAQGGTGATSFTSNGVLYGNGTGAVQVTAAGATGQCLVGNTGAAPSWGACASTVSLQAAYDGGNTISTSGGNIGFTMNGSDSFTIATAAGATGSTIFSLADGSNASPAAQLVRISNNDVNQILANGLTVDSAAGGITDGIDVSDPDIVNAVNVGDNVIVGGSASIDFTNFDVNGSGNLTAGTYNNQTIGSAANFTGTVTIQGANALTLGTTGTNTGAILFKGATAASGTLTLTGPSNPSTSNYTLSIPAITANANVCTDNSVCTGYQAAPASGSYLLQVPTTTGANTVTPTANSVVALTVNATSGTAAVGAIINQSQAADAVNVNVTNTTGTAGNGILIAKTGAGTLTNGLSFSGTIGTDINRSSGTLTLQGTGGVTITAGGTGTVAIDSASSGGTINLGNTNATTIGIGGGSGATTTIGGGNAAHTINIGAAGTSTVQAIAIGSAGSTSTLTLQGGTGTATGDINIGDQTTAGKIIDIGSVDTAGTSTVRIATGAAAQTVTLGSTNSTSTALIQGGTGAGAGSEAIRLIPATAGAIWIGNTAGTGAITLGSSSAAQNVNIANGAGAPTVAIANVSTAGGTVSILGAATATGNTDTVNIATGNTAGTGAKVVHIADGTPAGTGSNTVTIGSTANASGVTLQAGTGNINLNAATLQFTEVTGTRTITAATRTSNVTGTSITLQGGTGGSSSTGGTITVQGGSAGGGNTNGGGVVISGGSGAGSGVLGLVSLAPTTFISSGTTQIFNGGSGCPSCSVTGVDTYSSIAINAGVAGLSINIPVPNVLNQVVGRILYVTAVSGSQDFTILLGGTSISINMKANSTATLIWNGTGWTAAGASSSTDLQSAYNNTLATAGAAELVLNAPGGNADGLTIRNNGTTPIVGGLLEVQTSIGSNLLSVNNNATEYANNGGAESSTFTMWSAVTAGTVSRYTTVDNNVATGIASVFVDGSATANTGAKNTLAAALTPNLQYTVSFAIRHTSTTATFTTLDVNYSNNGTATSSNCSTGNTVTNGRWTRIICSFTAPSAGITSSNAIFITHSDGTDHDFYIDNLSVTISAGANNAADGNVSAGSLGTNWTAFGAGTAVTLETSNIYDTSGSVKVDTTNNTDRGVTNNLSITPSVSTQYLVTFYGKLASGTFTDVRVRYSRDGGTNFVSCVDYNTRVLNTSGWTKVTCLLTTDGTTATNADLIIDQPTAPGSTRTFYVDALTFTLNSNTASNVQVGGGNKGGPPTLFTLDRSAVAPIADNNDAYLGSMYYDTTTGRIQCYEADGWGACGAAPDNVVNLNPEYAGAVLNGGGVGTMTADFCSNDTALQVNTSLCSTGQARNYYKWTSPQPTAQTYSIYVTYQLPATFNGFASDDTVQLVGRVDSTSNASVTYEMYKSTGSAVTQCGSGSTNIISGGGGSANTWYSYGINGNESTGCSFSSSSAGNFIIFKINLTAQSNASAYVSTLSFTTTGR